MNDKIIIKGARENNLKNINLDIPRNKFVVFTGVSGSGKSSLAFNTIYEEGRRRYVDSLSNYAKQFLGGTKNLMLIALKDWAQQFLLNKKQYMLIPEV